MYIYIYIYIYTYPPLFLKEMHLFGNFEWTIGRYYPSGPSAQNSFHISHSPQRSWF